MDIITAPSSITITVFTRHSEICKKKNPTFSRDYKKCNCRKSLYIYEGGEDKVISAKTRSWEEAERFAQEQRALRDPITRKLREIEEREAEREAAAVAAQRKKTLSIEDATTRWINAQKPKTEGTARAHSRVKKRIDAWAADNNIATVGEVTADNLDEWRGEWGPEADEDYNQIGPTTQCDFQYYLKAVFKYVVDIGYLDRSPAANLKPIDKDRMPALPLSQHQFVELLAAIAPFCAAQTHNGHEIAAELNGIFLLQRWTGLRIGDAVSLPRAALVGNRISLITQKTGALIKDRIIPDHVAQALAALPANRPGFRKEYFFWRERVSQNSLVTAWTPYIKKLNSFLHFVDDHGNPMRFHSHMLRDTYAVELLLQGVPIEEVSKLLTHESIAITQKYYAPWVKSRLKKMEDDLVTAMRGMGASVTL